MAPGRPGHPVALPGGPRGAAGHGSRAAAGGARDEPAASPVVESPATPSATATSTDATAFRRRDRARHVAACAPAFPEPPARIALRFEDLAVEVAASSGRTTIERIVLLEDEVRRRDEDLARLAAWEATVADLDDAEVQAARAFAHAVFADLLADAADEAERRERAAARRAATGPLPTPVRDAAAARATRTAVPARRDRARDDRSRTTRRTVTATGAEVTAPVRDEPVRPALSLQAGPPVSASTRPTPLVQPATGPTVIDRAAFAAALTAHAGTTASTPVVLPEAVSLPVERDAAAGDAPVDTVDASADAGWWTRLVARLRALFGRR